MKFLMLTSAVLIACVLFLVSAKHHHECKEDVPKMKNAAKEIIDNGEAPACYKDLELDQFECDDDEEKGKEMQKKFKNWLKEQDDDKKNAVVECMMEFGGQVLGRVGDDLSQQCKDKIEEAKEKILEMMGQEE